MSFQQLQTIQTEGNLNKVFRYGEKGPGGAYHEYFIEAISTVKGNKSCR